MFKQRLFSHTRVVTYAAILMLLGATSIRALAADNRMFADGVIERHANWLQYKAYTPDNELNPLPSASTVDIAEDGAGFMWLAVYSSGLMRFDGRSLELYGVDDGLPSLLLNNMTFGPKGHLWVSTKAGLVMSETPLDRSSATSPVVFQKTKSGVRLSESALASSVVSIGDDIWILESDEYSLRRYQWTSGGELTEMEYSFDEKQTGRVASFTQSDADTMILSGKNGVFSFNLTSLELNAIVLPSSCPAAKLVHTGPAGQALVECSSGQLVGAESWTTWAEARVISAQSRSTRNSRFINIGDALHFVGAERYDIIDPSLKIVETTNASVLRATSLTDVHVDREGNLWLASDNGFRKLGRQRDAFSGVVYREGDVVFSATSFDIDEDGSLLIGGGQGLLVKKGERKTILNGSDGLPVNRVYAVRNTPYGIALGHARHYSFLKPIDGPRPQGLTNWKQIDVLGEPYELAFVEARATDITNVDVSGRRAVCILGAGELVCLGRFAPRRWTTAHGVPMSATETAFTEDGYLWVSAGSSGIKRSRVPFEKSFNEGGTARLFDKKSAWSEEDNNGKAIPVDGIIPIPSGLALCTEQGLRILKIENGNVVDVERITAEDGLAGNYMVSGMYNSELGLLYVAGNQGISAINVAAREVVWSVSKRQGLLDNELSWNSSLLSSRSGAVYMATPKGLAVYNHQAMKTNLIAPLPAFRRIVFEQDDNGYNELNVEFAALSFSNELKTQYQTRVEGYSDWSEPTSENRLRLMNLPALFFSKEYTLEVLAANDSGVWSEEPLRHSFTVKPAWWLRWYTLGLLALIIAAIVFTLRRQKLEAIVERDKAERYAADADAKSKALKETFDQLDEELKKRETLQAKNAELQRDNEIAAQQLVQADKLATMGTMVAGVAHDIANPTGLARSSLEMSADARQRFESFLTGLIPDDGASETKAVLEEIHQFFKTHAENEQDLSLAVERIADINEAIRNQARVDQSPSLVNVRSLIVECLTITKSRLTGIEVSIECEDSLEAMLVRSQFGQVLMNLLANASDAIREHGTGGSITISVTNSEPEGFVLILEDSGPGIPQELRPKILEPFFTTKDVGKGTGLGMPIVLRILEMHGLTLTIGDSERHGGAKMTIQLSRDTSEEGTSLAQRAEPTVSNDC